MTILLVGLFDWLHLVGLVGGLQAADVTVGAVVVLALGLETLHVALVFVLVTFCLLEPLLELGHVVFDLLLLHVPLDPFLFQRNK